MGKYLLYIFDLDGTILDSYKAILESVYETLSILNIKVDDHIIKKNIGVPLREYLNILGIEDIDNAIDTYRKIYKENSKKYHKLYSGIKNLLNNLKNKVLLSLITNKGKEITNKIIIDFQLDKYFDYIITEEEVKRGKPYIDSYYILLDKYKNEGKFLNNTEVLMIGDSNIDYEFAKNCKIDFAFVKWGFYSLNDISGKPTYVIEKPQDLIEINQFENIVEIEITSELDLHNYSLKDLKFLIDNYLNECYKNKIYKVRIIHGKGKGIKREHVKKFLNEIKEKNGIIKSFYDAPIYLGGIGAIIVELRKNN